MPKRTDIKKVMVIGSGPIVIGQAAEFDYAGTQACLALKEEGYEVILVNSNPATIMTDTHIADKVYMEPLTLEYVAKIIRYERPDAIVPGLGGQTGLNLAVQLAKKGVLQECQVEILGTSFESIEQAEDRELFKELCERLGEPVLPSHIANNMEEGIAAAESANNAVTGATLIPLLTLGIPGDGTVAIMLSALMINGLNPGLSLFTTDGDIMYAIMLGLILVNLFMLLQGKFLTTLFAKVVSIPQEILTPIIVIFCFAGAYSVNENYFDVGVALIFGVLAWVLRKLDLPPVPILLGLVLGGPGAEMAVQCGRDNGSIPKKLGAEFVIRRSDDSVTAQVTRRGTQLVDLKMELGQYNSPLTGTLYQFPAPGKKTYGGGFYFHFDREPDQQGVSHFMNGCLLQNLCEYTYHTWEPGFAALQLRSSVDDPWAELPIHTIVGGAYSSNDLMVHKLNLAEKVDADAVVPYLLTGRYDRTAFMETGRI